MVSNMLVLTFGTYQITSSAGAVGLNSVYTGAWDEDVYRGVGCALRLFRASYPGQGGYLEAIPRWVAGLSSCATWEK